MDSERIVVTQEDGMFVVGDEDGEFARASNIEQTLNYVRDLLYGPGTVKPLPVSADGAAGFRAAFEWARRQDWDA